MIPFEYLVADQLDPALDEYAVGTATLKAGGIDLLDLMKEGIETPTTVLSIGDIENLRYVRRDDDGVHIGCLTTLADIARNELLREQYAVLYHAAADAATPGCMACVCSTP